MDEKLAFIFPGQGSQSIGMLSELAKTYPDVEKTFTKASEVLNYDLWELVQQGPDTELNRTHITQPAMLVAGIAVWQVWQQSNGPIPAMMAGHSLGEYTALVCADVLSFETAIMLVEERGRLMQDAVPEGQGAMAAILGLDDDKVIAVCENAALGEVIAAVNFNSPGQVVIAGQVTAVNRAIDQAKQVGAKRALLLPVSVPSHCALMEPAANKMRGILEHADFQAPTITVINNVDVSINDNVDKIREALVRQLVQPVQWVKTIQQMAASGIETLIECGPGRVLTGLNKRIDRSLSTWSVYDPQTLDKAIENLSEVID